MAGLLDSISGFFAGPADPEAIDPRYGITQQQLYDAKMQSLGSAGLTLLAAGQRMQPDQRAQILAGLGNIPGQYQQGISQAMQQRLLASQLRSGEQSLAAKEAFAKRLAGAISGTPTAAGVAPMPGGVPMQGAAPMPSVGMPPSAARLTQPLPPSAPGAMAPGATPAAGVNNAELARLGLTLEQAIDLSNMGLDDAQAVFKQMQVSRLTEKPDFVEYPMSKEDIAAWNLQPGLPWTMGKNGPELPGGRAPAPTNINLPKGPGATDTRLGAVYIDSLVGAVDAGAAAKSGVRVNSQIREMLDKGAFTGMGSDIKTTVTLFADALGLAPDDELRKAQNSQLLLTTFASRGLEAARSNAGQGAVSNYERDILQKAAGGGLEMTEANMRYIADITDRIYAKQMENAALAGNILSSDDPYSLRSQWFKRTGAASDGAPRPEAPPASDSAPVPGAKKALDGKWYVLKDGQYFRVEGAQ